MMEKVLRDMAKDILRTATDKMVSDYLNKRFRSKHDDERDPLRMVANSILDSVMRDIAKDIGRSCLGGVVFDYLIEA